MRSSELSLKWCKNVSVRTSCIYIDTYSTIKWKPILYYVQRFWTSLKNILKQVGTGRFASSCFFNFLFSVDFIFYHYVMLIVDHIENFVFTKYVIHIIITISSSIIVRFKQNLFRAVAQPCVNYSGHNLLYYIITWLSGTRLNRHPD